MRDKGLKLKVAVLGSRITGAGFGGCVISLVNLVNKDAVTLFKKKVASEYKKAFGRQCEFYPTATQGGSFNFRSMWRKNL